MTGVADWLAHAAMVYGPLYLFVDPRPEMMTMLLVSLAAATGIEAYWIAKEDN